MPRHQCHAELTSACGHVHQNSGRPFDEMTVRTLSSVSPRQLSLRHEINGSEGQLGIAEPLVVLRFAPEPAAGAGQQQPAGKRPGVEPSRGGGLARPHWRNAGLAGGSASWKPNGNGGRANKAGAGARQLPAGASGLGGLQQMVSAACVEFRQRLAAYVVDRRVHGRALPRLHETEAPRPRPHAAALVMTAAAAAKGQGGWAEGQPVTALNFFEYHPSSS